MRRQYRAMTVATIVAVLNTVALAPGAQAAERPVTARPDGYGNGYNNVIGDKGAFQRFFRVGDSRVAVFSLAFRRSVDMGTSTLYSATGRRSVDIDQVDRAADIAVRSARIGEPLPDTNAEAAAVQLAIWMLTDGVDPTPTGEINAPIRRRAEALAAAASALPGGDRELSVGMSTKVTGSGDSRRLTVTITSSGDPLSAVPVSVTVGGTELDVRTNDDGVAIVKLAGVSEGTAYRASFRWRLPAGTVLVPADGAPVVTTTEAQGQASFSGKVPAAPLRPTGPATLRPATSTPTATPTPSVETTPSPQESSPEPSTDDETLSPLDSDPAQMVIEFTDATETTGTEPTTRESGSSLPAVIAAALFFVAAAWYALRRARNR